MHGETHTHTCYLLDLWSRSLTCSKRVHVCVCVCACVCVCVCVHVCRVEDIWEPSLDGLDT